ncbi:MAG: hypothetical protein AAGF87_09870 [Bacteroidota bacterium]
MFGKPYEYWPTMAFYWPIYLWGPWQAIRAGHPCFFSALNPGMEGGGIGFESKYEISKMIPDRHNPATIRILPGASDEEALKCWDRLREQCIENERGHEDDPFIAKPDIGYRGRLVKILEHPQQLLAYRRKYPLAMLLQEKISWPEEFGILYFRRWRDSSNLDIRARGLEDQNAEERPFKGTITSLTSKEFLSVVGDSLHTVAQLLEQQTRGRTQIQRLRREIGTALDQIPDINERVKLGEIGNHNLGTRFIDARQLITPALVEQFDKLAYEMPGFCYGRFDIKAQSLEAVEQGEFMILEINGALAEPTHLYDANKNSYLTAVRDIMAHWHIIGTLSRDNMRQGVRPMSVSAMLKKLYWFRSYAKKVKKLVSGNT